VDSGTLIADRYRLDAVIASGGMGSVWRAEDERLERPVAVKVLHAGLDGAQRSRDRFEREAKTLASLKGPGCVEVYDFGEERDGDRTVPFLVMELVEGVSLAELLHEEERLDPARTMRIVADAAEALAAAHRRGIVHRDVKPGNILVDADDRVKVVDFGISLFAHRWRLTPSDTVLGTAPYVSPEQLRGKDVTGASDLYSLGAVAFECLAGKPPFDAADPAAVIHGHLYSDPPPLPEDVPAEVAGVITKSLRKAPEERWESGERFAAAARAATTGAHPVERAMPPRHALSSAPAEGETASEAGNSPDESVAPTGESAPATPPAADEPIMTPSAGTRAEPPVAPPAGTLATQAEPSRKRRRLAVVGIAVALVLAVFAVAAWGPWRGDTPTATGEGDATVSAAAGAESADDPSASASATATEAAAETPSGDGATEDGEDDGGNEGGGIGDESAGGEETAAQDDTGNESSGEVPPVTGMTTFEARNHLEELGFTNVATELGFYDIEPEPEHCEVVSQNPASGQTVDYSSRIILSYHRRTSPIHCEW
jgi:serine/threonine-protein kinase